MTQRCDYQGAKRIPSVSATARLTLTGGLALALGFAEFLNPAAAFAQQAAAKDDTTLAEVVVTARRRNEAVETVPVTIDVLAGAALKEQGLYKFEDLQYSVPGFFVETYETRATIAMRGVGAQIAGNGAAVATHLNGIYQASTASSLDRLFDVERVEVLKGPQGTLYGRNSTGGAINIITKSPGHDFDVSGSLNYGSYSTKRAELAVDLPINGDWSVRGAASIARADGRITNQVTGRKIGNEDFTGGRITLAGTAGGVKVEFFGQYSDEHDNAIGGLIPVKTTTLQPLLGWDQTYLDNPTEPQLERKYLMTGLTLSGDLGNGYSWRSVTGYLHYTEPQSFLDVNPLPGQAAQITIKFPQYARQTSEELQLIYAGQRANWVFGALYMNARNGETRFVDIVPFISGALNSSLDNTVKTTAVFGDLNYNLTDQLRLNVGLRYNSDKVENSFNGLGAFDGPPFDRTGTQSEPTGRVGLDYTIVPGVMVYGSVSKGFQAGYFDQGFTGAGIPAVVEVKPETLYAYEVGLKSRLPGNFGFFNLAGFYYDYRNMQVSVGGIFFLPNGQPDPSQPPFFTTENAGKARIYGVDASLTEVRLADHLKAEIDAEYLDTKFKDYDTINDAGAPVSYAGNHLPRAPTFAATTALTLDKIALGNAESSLRLEYQYRGKAYDRADNIYELASHGLVNALASVDLAEGKWRVTAAGRNLTNKKFYSFFDGRNFALPGSFRTWEIGVGYHFR